MCRKSLRKRYYVQFLNANSAHLRILPSAVSPRLVFLNLQIYRIYAVIDLFYFLFVAKFDISVLEWNSAYQFKPAGFYTITYSIKFLETKFNLYLLRLKKKYCVWIMYYLYIIFRSSYRKSLLVYRLAHYRYLWGCWVIPVLLILLPIYCLEVCWKIIFKIILNFKLCNWQNVGNPNFVPIRFEQHFLIEKKSGTNWRVTK